MKEFEYRLHMHQQLDSVKLTGLILHVSSVEMRV
jgi:hypothetical protein